MNIELNTPTHLLQLGLGEIGHGEELERIVPRQAPIPVFDRATIPYQRKSDLAAFIHRQGKLRIRQRVRRIVDQTFVGEGEPLEVGVALLLEVPFLGRRVRPHLSPRLVHLPLSSLVRRGEERRGEGGGPERQAGDWCVEENAALAEARAGERLPAG